MNEPKYPDVTVQLVGEDGNAYNLIGLTTRALRRARVPAEEIKIFTKECFNSPNYDALLQTIMKWVNIE